MTIATICEKIGDLISKVRAPMAQIPAVLIACSAIQRPGLSAMVTASNIIRRQAEAGAYFGPLADGSRNIEEAMEVIRVEEIFKAIKEEMSIQGSIAPGAATLTGTAATAGGPAPVTVTNPFAIKINGIAG